MRVRFLRAAADEFREAIEFYSAQKPGLGQEFRDEVFNSIERIKQLPFAWSPLSANTRRCLTRKFPYGIIYEATEREIIIVAVGHLHREPDHC